MSKEKKTILENTILHGADFNPDQWLFDPKVRDEDLRLMKLAKCNFMSIGMFSWTSLEPEEGVYTFDWLEEVIDDLYAEGIYTFLATPGGARPAWMSQKYPEVLRVNSERVRNLHGDRHNHCMTSPIYREMTGKINQTLAQRFAAHPGVILWHINNEYSGHCHCELCQEAFRDWLKEKYGTLDALNHAWWTKFWSHTYTDWSQIESPSMRGEHNLHGLNLDWKRFMTHQTKDFLEHEIRTVHEIDPSLPTTHNFWDYIELGSGIDPYVVAQPIDIVSWDNYPIWDNPSVPNEEEALRRAFLHDLNRSMKQQPFLVMESSPSVMNWQEVAKLPRPGMLALSSLQAVAHGADGIGYFQWRKSLGSSEKFHGAVVDHYATTESRVFNEVKAVGNLLDNLGKVQGAMPQAPVAIVYDLENAWAYYDSEGPLRDKIPYFDILIDHYSYFARQSIAVDVINHHMKLDPYKVVIAPFLYLLSESFAEEIKAFVQRGGTFIAGPWTGIVDEHDLCYRNGRPGPLRDMLGIWVEETDALYPREVRSIHAAGSKEKLPVASRLLDLIHTEDAVADYFYAEDFYEGYPAITQNSYGDGKAIYLGFHSTRDFLHHYYQALFAGKDLGQIVPDLPAGIQITYRQKAARKYIFVLNFTDQTYELSLPWDCLELLDACELTKGSILTIAPRNYEVLVVEET